MSDDDGVLFRHIDPTGDKFAITPGITLLGHGSLFFCMLGAAWPARDGRMGVAIFIDAGALHALRDVLDRHLATVEVGTPA